MNSLRRLGEFLSEPELPSAAHLPWALQQQAELPAEKLLRSANADGEVFRATDAELSWGVDRTASTLGGLNFSIKKGKINAIVGPVGVGKSSLISCMLGEMELRQGDMSTLDGSIAFVPQKPWIVNDTVRGNITFGSQFDEVRYQQVIDACCLLPDFASMPGGDETEIGERGINLSGGQKSRISLARAVYSQKEVYLLDDLLAAVDVHVGKKLFDGVIKPTCEKDGPLGDATVVIVTNQLHILPEVNHIILMAQNKQGSGCIQAEGTYEEMRAAVMDNCDRPQQEEQEATPAAVAVSGGAKVEDTPPPHEDTTDSAAPTDVLPTVAGELVGTEEMSQGAVPFAVYKQYAMLAGGFFHFVGAMLFCLTLDECLRVAGALWLAIWAGDMADEDGYETSEYLMVYFCLCIGQWLTHVVKGLVWVTACVRAARALHSNLLARVLRAPLSFFDKTPVGRLLNRFSRDTNEIDSELIWLVDGALTIGMQILGKILVIITIMASVVGWALIGAPFVFASYFLLFTYFGKTNISLKRHESVRRSPVFTHFAESIDGADSIRAFTANGGSEMARFERASQDKIDVHHAVFFTEKLSEQWFQLYLACITAVVMAALMAVVVLGQGKMSPSVAALALSYGLELSMLFQFAIFMWTMCAQKFNCVERVLEYTDTTEQEAAAITDVRPKPAWPTGRLTFENFTMRYRPGLEPVLRDVTFEIQAGEKVGIVGRTGAGKSSLVSALFRLVERDEDSGPICIDGLDVATLGLRDLRQAMTMVPQDPVLFSGTLRQNLSPDVPPQHSDAEIEQVLKLCGLESMLKTMDAGLGEAIYDGGGNLSVGERQLVCLARALLRKPKILVMDEATANVDLQTDAMIQSTLRSTDLASSTVIVIAHRLHTIMDMDKIVVLAAGRVIEFGSPAALLADKHGVFTGMVDEGQDAAQLREIARGASTWAQQEKDDEHAPAEEEPASGGNHQP